MTAVGQPEEIPVECPIIIVGAPRSGTTLLSRILEAHPDVMLIGEPRLTWRYGNEQKTDMLRPADARPEVRRFIRSTFVKQMREAGKSRFVEKSPHNSLRLDFVASVLPEARFVHIMRDGRESVVSIRDYWTQFSGGFGRGQLRQRVRELDWRRAPYYARELLRRTLPKAFSPVVGPRLWGPQIPGLTQLVKELDLIEVCALQWRMCVETACDQGRRMPADRYMECRLEDFSPELITRILDFCALPDAEPVWDEYNRRFDVKREDKRKGQATPEEMTQMMHWIAPTLEWLGYE